MMGLRYRLDRLEQRLWERIHQAYKSWLHQLTEEQHKVFADRLLEKLREEGLCYPDANLQTLSPASQEEEDSIIASIMELWQEMASGPDRE